MGMTGAPVASSVPRTGAPSVLHDSHRERTEHAEIKKELQKDTRKTNEAVDSERRARESAVTALRKQLEGFGAGGPRYANEQ